MLVTIIIIKIVIIKVQLVILAHTYCFRSLYVFEQEYLQAKTAQLVEANNKLEQERGQLQQKLKVLQGRLKPKNLNPTRRPSRPSIGSTIYYPNRSTSTSRRQDTQHDGEEEEEGVEVIKNELRITTELLPPAPKGAFDPITVHPSNNYNKNDDLEDYRVHQSKLLSTSWKRRCALVDQQAQQLQQQRPRRRNLWTRSKSQQV
jgi:hypothetical protein